MGEDTDTNAAEIQVLNQSQLTTETYHWFKKRSAGNVGPSDCRVPCPEGANGQWFLVVDADNDEYAYPDPADPDTKREFVASEGFLLDAEDGASVTVLAPFDL